MANMEHQQDYIVTQCYGNEGVFLECAYCLLSLSRLYNPEQLSNLQIWVYTDNPGWFKMFKDCSLPVYFRAIDHNTIKAWRGRIDFVHRVKIELLKDFTKDKNGNILYVDTDVIFTHNIDSLFQNIRAGKLYMHVNEGLVSSKSNPMLTKLDAHLRDNSHLKVNGRPVNELSMWNAGVLGFNTVYRYLLDEVLAYTDAEYPAFPKHIIEQFAFSVYFQQTGVVKCASPYILHYWNLKEARPLLASFFHHFNAKSWQDLVAYSSLIQIPVLMQDKINYLLNKSLLSKLGKTKWTPAPVDWNDLIRQL